MAQDSPFRTILVATGICLVCSLFVSTAAVVLQPRQGQNQRLDRIENVLAAGHLAGSGGGPEEIFKQKVSRRLVRLDTGETVTEAEVKKAESLKEEPDIQAFENIKKVMDDPRLVEAIEPDRDKAGIKRRPKYLVVYRVEEQGVLQQVILPVFGKGLWSTLYGYLALEGDLQTVSGITFYEHGETPGLGGEVDNKKWKASWQGKEALDQAGKVMLEVLKGKVDPQSDDAKRQIDGLSGATFTTRGVDQLIKYWLGEEGFGPFLQKLREEH